MNVRTCQIADCKAVYLFVKTASALALNNRHSLISKRMHSPRFRISISPRGKPLNVLRRSTSRPFVSLFEDDSSDEEDEIIKLIEKPTEDDNVAMTTIDNLHEMETVVATITQNNDMTICQDLDVILPEEKEQPKKKHSLFSFEYSPTTMDYEEEIDKERKYDGDFFSGPIDLELNLDLSCYPKATFNRDNRFELDDHVQFIPNPEHKYLIDGDGEYIKSVTEYIGTHLFQPFPEETVAYAITLSKDYENNVSPYSGKTSQQIVALWENLRQKGCLRGERIHRAIYNYFETCELYISPYLPAGFLEFRKHYPTLQPIRTEHALMHRKSRICGSTDLLGEDPDHPGEYILIDYKTNLERNLVNEKEKYFGKRWRENHPSVAHMHDTPWSHDIVQLHFYARFYSEGYNIKIKKMFVLHFPSKDPQSKEYHLLPIPPFPELDSILQERIKDMQLLGY